MPRYWISFWTGNYADEGCAKPPFTVWNSGERERDDDRTEVSLCAVVDANDEDEIWEAVFEYFPDFNIRFCHIKPDDFVPGGDRFPADDILTRLYA